jgi:hypothetical protein
MKNLSFQFPDHYVKASKLTVQSLNLLFSHLVHCIIVCLIFGRKLREIPQNLNSLSPKNKANNSIWNIWNIWNIFVKSVDIWNLSVKWVIIWILSSHRSPSEHSFKYPSQSNFEI